MWLSRGHDARWRSSATPAQSLGIPSCGVCSSTSASVALCIRLLRLWRCMHRKAKHWHAGHHPRGTVMVLFHVLGLCSVCLGSDEICFMHSSAGLFCSCESIHTVSSRSGICLNCGSRIAQCNVIFYSTVQWHLLCSSH